MTENVVAMFGLSGVGKGWLARQVSKRRPEVLYLEASALMRGALQTTSEGLRTARADVLKTNQNSLVAAFARARLAAPGRPVLFDGHSVIDNDAGLVEIPLEVIAGLEPRAIVFVFDEVSAIAERRLIDRRNRPKRSLDELASHQARARVVAASYADNLGIRFAEIRSGDWGTVLGLFELRP